MTRTEFLLRRKPAVGIGATGKSAILPSMSPSLDRGELRSTLADFDDRRKKIVGGVLTVMFREPARVRDREWIAEQFTQVLLLTGGFASPEEVQIYARDNIHPLLNACYALFAVVGEDLAPRAADGFSHAEAMFLALSYFDPPETGEDRAPRS